MRVTWTAWQTQLETHETVERFLFPVEYYSDGRLKHKYTRPPDTTDARARFNMLLCSEVTHVTQVISAFSVSPQGCVTAKNVLQSFCLFSSNVLRFVKINQWIWWPVVYIISGLGWLFTFGFVHFHFSGFKIRPNIIKVLVLFYNF